MIAGAIAAAGVVSVAAWATSSGGEGQDAAARTSPDPERVIQEPEDPIVPAARETTATAEPDDAPQISVMVEETARPRPRARRRMSMRSSPSSPAESGSEEAQSSGSAAEEATIRRTNPYR